MSILFRHTILVCGVPFLEAGLNSFRMRNDLQDCQHDSREGDDKERVTLGKSLSYWMDGRTDGHTVGQKSV